MRINGINGYDRIIECPPDKSESVRAVLFCAAARGTSTVQNISLCDDVLSAVSCVRSLGAAVEVDGSAARISGVNSFKSGTLDCGNSGTCARLLCGLLAGSTGEFTITGDSSLCARPMDRAVDPLRQMGANITSTDGRLPVKIIGTKLRGVDYKMPIDSAQVKSAVLLAGINADGNTTVTERHKTRDHTERMLEQMGAHICVDGNTVSVSHSTLKPLESYVICGDVSAAVYPAILALCINSGKCVINNVSNNPTRTMVWNVLRSAGADISFTPCAENAVNVTVRQSTLKPLSIDGEIVPYIIDELPALCALACFIDGKSVISGAGELRVKESDRIAGIVAALGALGADVSETSDGLIINGGKPLRFGKINSNDHRIVMAAAVAGALGGGAEVDEKSVSVSYPRFFKEVLGQ